jgi:hypothetical protein
VTQRSRIGRDVERIVALRRIERVVDVPSARKRLTRIRRELRLEIASGVPKSQAASILGVSVTALDKWIARRKLPIVRRPGSSRREIDADALIDLAEEVGRLREAGERRGLLASALANLEGQGRLGELRPNQSARELREHYLRTTPSERLREAAELSRVLTHLAERGASSR